MAELSPAEQNRVIRLLERESQNKITNILRSGATLLNWLADVIDTASVLWQRIRPVINDLWRSLRSLFS